MSPEAAVRCGLSQQRWLEALRWTWQPHLGLHWCGRQGLGVISIILFSQLHERFKAATGFLNFRSPIS